MILKKWLPWKFIIKRAAQAYGFLDPVTLMARLRRFGHPSEVQEPIELIRAGVVFHARGLINTRAIQYNLDWIWPFWISKQFRPNDISFIPRGFSFSHVNLTHRNWTAVGHPDIPCYPIADPRGLVTPYLDGWSLDFWILSEDGQMLVPSECDTVQQQQNMEEERFSIETRSEKTGLRLETELRVEAVEKEMQTCIYARAFAEKPSWLVLSFRPYNPEGIQFIDSIAFDRENLCFRINQQDNAWLSLSPEKVLFSHYEKGDVGRILHEAESSRSVNCDIGMATAAALFPLKQTQENNYTGELKVSLPLADASAAYQKKIKSGDLPHQRWETLLSETARVLVPDKKIQFLYEAAVRTMLLLTADEAYPGPYTYKRFWFRDACLMIHALLAVGHPDRVRRMILKFPARQTIKGYFQSQEGEWDSNGQVLWIADRLHELGGTAYDDAFMKSLFKGADWIIHKRIRKDTDKAHYGLFPAGFSAEHLGPNDYYYWDNFWGVAGLRAAARLADAHGFPDKTKEYSLQADAFMKCVRKSIENIPVKQRRQAIPASPYRRMDAGAVGSLVADYPLQLTEAGEPMIMNTVNYLTEHCFHSGAFFQDMIHSGLNIYLTLAIAQTLLRAGNPDYKELIRTVADLASPTGQWPEAVHPFTKGGCMGDGQHGWAAAEWLMMIRNLFVREENGKVIIGSGIFPEWIESGQELFFGPTMIPGGKISVRMCKSAEGIELDAEHPPVKTEMMVNIPGYRIQKIENGKNKMQIRKL